MSAFKIVQKIPSLTIGSAAGISTSGPIALKSGYLRIVPTGNAYIELDTNPGISTSTSIWVAANSELVLKESVRSEPVVGILTGNTYIELDSNPGISTSTSIWVAANSELVLKESVRSEPVVGILTGATTTVIFPEGTGSVFNVGDYVELTGVTPSGINTNFAQVASVDNTTNYNGYHNTRLVLNWNTSAQSNPVLSNAELRKVTKIAAYNDSANPNTIHITEVQVVSNFS